MSKQDSCVVVYTFPNSRGVEFQFLRETDSQTYLARAASRRRLVDVLNMAINAGRAHVSPALNGGYFCYVHRQVAEIIPESNAELRQELDDDSE